MTIKKILAGVLAAASVMTMSVTASAVEAPDKTKAVTKPGTAEYEAGIGFLTAELDVELPAQMKAFLNPYGASVAVTEDATPVKLSSNIVSWAYEVVNNTEDFAIAIDVVDAVATTSKDVTLASTIADADTTKKAVVVLKAADDANNLAYDSSADTANGAGCVVFTGTKTTQKKFASVPAKTATGAGKTYIGITGALTDIDKLTTDWTDEDTITCTYTLKINPAADGATGGGAAGGFTAEVPSSAVSFSTTDFVVGALVANNTYAVAFDANSTTNVTPTFTGKTLDDASSSDTSKATVRTSDGRISAVANGTTTIKYDFDDGTSISFEVTITNA